MSDNLPVIPDHTLPISILDKLHWRDLRIPADIFLLLLDKTISSTEVLLLAIIDGGVRVRGEGCWITNGEFANALGIKRHRNIEKMVSKLKRLNLIKQVGWKMHYGKKCRLLETAWSRVSVLGVHSTVFKDGGVPSLKTGYSTNVERRQTVEDHRSSTVRENSSVINEDTEVPSKAPNGQMFPLKQLGVNAVKRKGEIEPIDRTNALRLRKTVVAKTNAKGRWKHSKWADEFRMLRESVNNDRVRVDNVLEWYLDHIGGKYVHVALCAKTFREKFLKIEAQMEKDYTSNPAYTQIRDEVKPIVQRLTSQVWPKVSVHEVAVATQMVVNHARTLWQKVTSVKNPKLQSFVQFLKSRQYIQPLQFAERWMRDVYEKVKKWETWDGNLHMNYLMWDGDVNHKTMKRHGMSWSNEFVGHSGLWFELAKEVA